VVVKGSGGGLEDGGKEQVEGSGRRAISGRAEGEDVGFSFWQLEPSWRVGFLVSGPGDVCEEGVRGSGI